MCTKRILGVFLALMLWPSIQAEEKFNTTYEIDIPSIGKITLQGNVDIINQAFELSGSLKEKKVAFGPIELSEGTVGLSNVKGLSITGSATLFNKKARVGIKELKPDRTTLGVELETPLEISITPWDKISLKSIEVSVTKEKAVTISAQSKLFAQDITINFGTGDKKETIEVILATLNPSALVPDVKGTLFEKIAIKNVTLSVENFVRKTGAPPLKATMKGTIDFSGMGIAELKQDLAKLSMTATIDQEKGFSFAATLPQSPEIPGVGSIKNAKLIFNLNPKKDIEKAKRFSLVLAGSTDFDIPKIGKLAITLAAEYREGKFALESTIDKPIKFDIITIEKARVKIDPVLGTIEISGDSSVTLPIIEKKVSILAKLSIEKATKDKPADISFEGEVRAEEKLEPFKKTGIPGIKDIYLSSLRVTFEKVGEKSTIAVKGFTTVLNTPFEATVGFSKTGQEKGVFISGDLPEGWSIGQSIRLLATTKLNDLNFSAVSFTISSFNFDNIKKGINFSANLALTGPMANVNKLMGNKLKDLKIYGVLSTDPKEIVIGTDLPYKLDLKSPNVEAGAVTLEITGEQAINLKTQLTVKPTKYDSPIVLTAKVTVGMDAAEIAGTMAGFWNNPLGIKGLAIGDVAMEIRFLYEAEGLPSGAGITGTVKVGDKTFRMAFKGSEDEIILLGELVGELTLEDILSFAVNMSKKLDVPGIKDIKIAPKDIPEVAIRDSKLFFAPKGGKIGELTFDKGISVKGEIELFGKKAYGNFNVSGQGFTAEGFLSEIKLPLAKPILVITGPGLPEKKEPGPAFSIALNTSKQHVMLAGEASIFDIKGKTEVRLSKEGFKLYVSGKIFDLFEGKIDIEGAFKKPYSFSFDTFFKQEALNKLNALIKESAKEFKTESIKDLEAARKAANEKINKQIEENRTKIAQLQEEKKKLQAQVAAKTKAAQADIAKAQKALDGKKKALTQSYTTQEKKVADAQRSYDAAKKTKDEKFDPIKRKLDEGLAKVDRLKGEIDDLKKQKEKASKLREKAKLAAKILVKEGEHKIANLAIKGLQKAVDLVAHFDKDVISKAATLTLEKTKLAGLKIGGKTYAAVLKPLQKALDIAKKKLAAVAATPEAIKLAKTEAEIFRFDKVREGLLELSKKATEKGIDIAELGAKGLAELGEFAGNIIGGAFNIEKMSFKGASNKLPIFAVKGKLGGISFDETFTFPKWDLSAKDVRDKVKLWLKELISKVGKKFKK